MTPNFNRRQFPRGTSLLGLGLTVGGLAAPHIARASTSTIRIVSNPGLDNATLNAMIEQLGLFKKFTMATDNQVHFCDPKSPWQRVSNKNTMGCSGSTCPRVWTSRVSHGFSSTRSRDN